MGARPGHRFDSSLEKTQMFFSEYAYVTDLKNTSIIYSIGLKHNTLSLSQDQLSRLLG